MQKYLKRYYQPFLWMGVIFFVSSQSSLPQAGEGMLDVLFKKLAHMIEYGILYWLWWRALSQPKPVGGKPMIVALLISVLYAFSDEYHQSLVPLRQPKLADVLIDTLGALMALAMVRWKARLHRGVD